MFRLALFLSFALAASGSARASTLNPQLGGLSFLVGKWSSGRGNVADTGGTSTGSSTISVEVNGAVLLRRDHTNLFSASGAPAGGFDQIMMIYAENGHLHADYADGTHVIHYTSAVVNPGRSVVFTGEATPGGPVFKLGYALIDARKLSVSFSVLPPGAVADRPIAAGTLLKVD